jgi:hypothetical protein
MGCATAEMVVINSENSLKLLLSNIVANANALLAMTNMRKLTPKLRIFGNRLYFRIAGF